MRKTVFLLLAMLLVCVNVKSQTSYMKIYFKDGNREEFPIVNIEHVEFGEKELDREMIYGGKLYSINSVRMEKENGFYELSLYSQPGSDIITPDIQIIIPENRLGESIDLTDGKEAKIYLNGIVLTSIEGTIVVSKGNGAVKISIAAIDGTCNQKVQVEYSGAYVCESERQALIQEVKEFLIGDIVLSTKITMSGHDKTYYDVTGGCPVVFRFDWNKDDNQTFIICAQNISLDGETCNFKCTCKLLALSSWEQNEYTSDGWIKFYGTDGSCWGKDEEEPNFSSDGSSGSSTLLGSFVQGYYNKNSHQVQLIINYNMMSICYECPLQTIDKSKLDNYDRLKTDYEAALKKASEEEGK